MTTSQNMPVNIVGGATFGRYGKISQENTYNMFVTDNALVPYLGYKSVLSIPGQEGRGLFYSPINNVMLAVVDSSIFLIDTSLNYQRVGGIKTSKGIVYITANNASPSQFAISDLSYIYIYTYGGTVTQVDTLPENFLPGYIDFQDSYFICGDRRSSAWNLSHSNDGTNWTTPDPNDGYTYQGAYETKPDTVQATVVFNRIVFVMANNGTEMWQDVGNDLFPYQRNNYYAIDYGVVSIPTIAEGFGYLVWLAKNEYSSPIIMVSTGGPPSPISTDGISYVLSNLEHPEDSSAFMFQNSTHIFYQITFYSDNLTLVYDFTTQMFFTATDENLNYHIAKRFCHFNNKNYFVPYGNNKDGTVSIYEMSSSYTTYDGVTIPRFRICAPIRNSGSDQFLITNLSLTMEQGATNQLQRVGVSMCKNGGLSFGNIVEKECNPQAYGQNKMQWWQLGAANDVTFKFQFWSGDSDEPERTETGNLNERFVIINAQAEVTYAN